MRWFMLQLMLWRLSLDLDSFIPIVLGLVLHTSITWAWTHQRSPFVDQSGIWYWLWILLGNSFTAARWRGKPPLLVNKRATCRHSDTCFGMLLQVTNIIHLNTLLVLLFIAVLSSWETLAARWGCLKLSPASSKSALRVGSMCIRCLMWCGVALYSSVHQNGQIILINLKLIDNNFDICNYWI